MKQAPSQWPLEMNINALCEIDQALLCSLAESVSDFPAIGDFVMIDCAQSMGNAIIHHIPPRKNIAKTVKAEKAKDIIRK
ncbi:MAG: hypothetical protein PHV03_08360 [Desulfitobacteriaceae bacterium]|nr:hypothetical protein [Desulfitobacteriaceae bacterium]MDD4401938.1 hypothetical protein [Desulfitobacteriaceae bacterium]